MALDDAPAPVVLHRLTWGRPGGPRVLLVHGVQSGAMTWWQIASALSAQGCQVIAPDLRGHGSSPGAAAYGLDDFARDLQELDEDPWALAVGHSLSGTVVARALADHASFANAAVLLEPVFDLPEHDFDALVAGQLQELATARYEDIHAEHPHWHPEDCRLKALAAERCSPFVNEAVLRDNRPWNYSGLLAAIAQPTVILGGDPEVGAMLDPERGQSLAGAYAHVDYRRCDGGHSPHRDDPEGTIELLLEALRRER